MKRTFKKTTTPEGFQRKLDRMVLKELSLRHHALYEQLCIDALNLIIADNEDPRSKIVTAGLDVVHHTSARLQQQIHQSKQDRRDWVNGLVDGIPVDDENDVTYFLAE